MEDNLPDDLHRWLRTRGLSASMSESKACLVKRQLRKISCKAVLFSVCQCVCGAISPIILLIWGFKWEFVVITLTTLHIHHFMQLILPQYYSGLYTNQYCVSVTLTFSVAVTYAYNTFAYIIPISLQMHSVNVTLPVCMFQSEMSHDQ